MVVFNYWHHLSVTKHARLRDVDFRRLKRREQNVVVGRVTFVGETFRHAIPAEVIAASGGDVQRPENFLVLNIASGNRQALCTETEFTNNAGRRIRG